ncbi:MAG TPA: RNA polymerase sigma factor [Haliangiales bacterium]|nr:RNA polymerase sigma factor [Haliangiales bacterium]
MCVLEVIRRAIGDHWRRVWNLAFRMTLDRAAATDVVEETYLRAFMGADHPPPPAKMEAWLFRIAAHVVENCDRGQEVSFELLDEKLRSEPTRTDVVTSLTRPERNFYLWELKQGCMTSVVNCLPPGERVAFVMSVILGYSDEDAADVLGITTSAFKVRLSRSRKKVSDYLAPRCEHVDPRNPCRCPSRLGVALTGGFIPRAHGSEVSLRPDFGRYGSTVDGEDAPLRDVMAIYHSLPEPDPPDDLAARLLAKLDSGEWNELLERTKASPPPR